jgi:hypothetical protein
VLILALYTNLLKTMQPRTFTTLLATIIVVNMLPLFATSMANPVSQPQSFVNYLIPNMNGWHYIGENRMGDSYLFQNRQQNITISLKKEPFLCENSQEFNKMVLKTIQDLPKTQEYMEQRKAAVAISFLGQKNGHMVIVKSRANNQRRFVLNHLLGTQMYHIEIAESGNSQEPSAQAVAFIGQIVAGDGKGSPPVAEIMPPLQQQVTAHSQNNPPSTSPGQLTGSTVGENNAVRTGQTTSTGDSQKQGASDTSRTSNTTKQGEGFTPPANISFNPGNIEKGNIPEVKFSATDPCVPAANNSGLPWDRAGNTKIDLPKDVTAIVPPVVPNLQQLSEFSFNSAVSTAFEAMRLVYGPMSDSEAQKFEAAWAPMFDYPTQEIIEYLNNLNPLVSQFLACRESYIRNLNDIHMVMFDAAIAIEDDDRYAWEAAMAEAALYNSILQSLDATMKKLASQIEALGNPPDPNAAKCEAQRRYKRFFEEPVSNECGTVLEGVWVGYSDGHIYAEFFEKQPVCIMFYAMPMKNPFHEDLMCYIEGYNLTLNGFGYNKEWTNMNLRWEGPISEIHWSEDMVTGLSAENTKMEFTFIKTVGEREFPIRVILQKATDQLPAQAKGADINRLRELEKIYETTQKQLKTLPAKYSAGLNMNNPSEAQSAWHKYENSSEYEDLVTKAHSCNVVMDQLENLLEGIPIFHKASLKWLDDLPLDINGADSPSVYNRMGEFVKLMQNVVAGVEIAKTSRPTAQTTANINQPAKSDLSEEEQVRKEAIAFHSEMLDVIKHNLERDIAERNEVRKELATAKNADEAKRIANRIKEFDMRIIHHQSNMQAEQDLVTSHQTGQLVRTRTVFDDYAHHKFIQDTRENAARMDATRRIAERINRQIELLPEEIRAEARERAYQILDANTVGSGDIEKAKKLVNAINNQVQGYAGYDYSMAKEAEVNSELNEFYAQMGIVAAGAVFVGVGSSALAQAYGAQSAAAIYGTKALGAIYGGTTGAIAGGPKEGATSAISYWSPYGYATTQFIEGFQRAGLQKDADMSNKVWQGAKQAGAAWVMGKSFELGAGLVAKGSQKFFSNESRLFKPIIKTNTQRSKEMLDGIRTQNKTLNANDEVGTFRKLETELAILKRNPVANSPKIAQMEKELNQLAAGLNMNYFTKWNLKYKSDPLTRSKFDRRVQQNYAEMAPGMKSRLEQQGYNMEGIEFKQFRNANSGGTSSMDLDLVPVRIGTRNEPAITINGKKMVMKKDGNMVSLEQFTDDAQKAMNAEYHRVTGLSAPASEMNLVTSVHKEAFSTAKLLDHNVDFSTFTPDEVASIGKVLQVKMDGINKNQMLTNTTKMQARCRESSKEIENMLLRKLNSDLQKAPAGSPQRKQIEADIKYWDDMLKRFKTIGTEETNPTKIMQLNREIMKETGGRDVNGVISDLQKAFGA